MNELRNKLSEISPAVIFAPCIGFVAGLTFNMFHYLKRGHSVNASADTGLIVGLLLTMGFMWNRTHQRFRSILLFFIGSAGFFEVTTGSMPKYATPFTVTYIILALIMIAFVMHHPHDK